MAAKTGSRNGLKFEWALGENNWNTGMDENLKFLDWFGVHLSFKSILNTPPASPSSGDCYIVGAAPTGLWVGKSNQVAVYDDGAWRYATPRKGWMAFNETTKGRYVFDTAWVTTAVFSSVQLSGGTGTQGTFSWNTDEETADLIQNGAVLQLGQETQVHCRNNTGSTIPNGTAVMATGTLGASGRITIAPMVASVAANAKFFLGLVTHDIANGADGKVTVFGKVRGLNTSAWADGAVLYCSTSSPGVLTSTKPTTGNALPVAFVVYSHAVQGTLMVRAANISENIVTDWWSSVKETLPVLPFVSTVTNSNTGVTVTAAAVLGGILTGTPTGDISFQLPTGTNMDAAFTALPTGQAISWSLVNLAAATHVITVTANTAHTVVGNMAVAANTSGRFLTRKTGTNTFVTYRAS